MTEPGDAPRTGSGTQGPDAAAAREQRHSRLERLARELTSAATTPVETKVSTPVLVAAGAAVVLLLAWLLWPVSETPRERATAQADEVARLQARLAERVRRRKAQERSGGDYLARSAAADSALLADLASRAERVAAALDAPKARAPQVKPAASAKPAPAVPTEAASSGPTPTAAPKAEPQPEPASAPPAQVATAAPPQPAAAAPAPAEECRIHVSELSSSGKLTYDDITRMKGARVDEKTRHAFTPPVQVKGRSVVFDVSPSGCVTVARSFGR